MFRLPLVILLLAFSSINAQAPPLEAERFLEETAGPTEEDEDGAPTIATEYPTSTVAPTQGGTQESSMGSTMKNSGECTSFPVDVMVDIQIRNQKSACTTEDDALIAQTIRDTLGANFEGTVTNWVGTADFNDSEFAFDPSGTRNDARRLRGNGRRTEEGTCVERGDLECEDPYLCRWGCLEVQTTECAGGESSLDQWTDLSTPLTEALKDLNLRDCLGSGGNLKATVHLDGGDEIETSAPTEAPIDTRGGLPDDYVTASDLDMDDGDDIVFIDSVITVKFFAGGSGSDFVDADGNATPLLQTFEDRFVQAAAGKLFEHDDTKQAFSKFSVHSRTEHYDEESRFLQIHFISKVEFDSALGGKGSDTARTIARVIAELDLPEFVLDLKTHDIGGINTLKFKATGKGV